MEHSNHVCKLCGEGEIEGVMVAAGRYRNRPSIQIRTELYGFVWCVLPKSLIERFGNEHTMAEIWEGKTLGVNGRLYYAVSGELTFIDAIDIREITAAPRIDLESSLDQNFTAGMEPHEYLEKLHEGSDSIEEFWNRAKKSAAKEGYAPLRPSSRSNEGGDS